MKRPVSLCKLKELIQEGILSIVNTSSEVKPKYVGILQKEYIPCEKFISNMQFTKFLYEITSGIPVDVTYEIVGSNALRIEIGKLCSHMETIYFADCVFESITVEELEKKLVFSREDLFEEVKQGKWW